MKDSDILRQLETLVGTSFPHTMEDGQCTELNLTDEKSLYHGLIRHHSAAVKQDILRLVCRLTGLRRLNLRRNHLFGLPPEFARLVEMEHLILGSNYLGLVPESIRGFRRLRSLHLGNNDLTEIPVWLGEYQELEYLALHKNIKLKSVANLRGLSKLKSLNLYLLNLLTLPDCIYEFRSLSNLLLWNVRKYPQGLEPLQCLEFFSVCGSPGLHSLPPDFTRLKNLRMTRLHQNSLEALPDDLGDLAQLEQISLYQNQLSALPDSMAKLTKLTKLNLGWNQFRQLPTWLGALERLEWLGIFENPLERPFILPERAGRQVAREWPFSTVLF